MKKHWFVGSDHAGFALKTELVRTLIELGDTVIDLGTNAAERCDYPDYAKLVALRVAKGEGIGLLCCGSGLGMSMTANRFAGVRAAVVTSSFEAEASRAHNDANILCLGERVVGVGVANRILKTFRQTEFEGGRHAARVAKIEAT